MDSKQKFVISYAIVSLIPFTVLTFFSSTDLSLYMTSFIMSYVALKIVLSPKFRTKVDIMIYAFFIIFLLIIAVKAVSLHI